MLGYAREIVSAYLFGDRSPVYDAFLTAWRVPNLFRRFLGEGALSTALQRGITKADAEDGEASGRALFTATLKLLSWILLGLCALLMLAAWSLPEFMPGTGYAWLGEDPGPVKELTVRLAPFVVLICLSAIVGGGLQVRGRYLASYVAPIVLNLAWIGALCVVGVHFGWGGGGADPSTSPVEYARHFDMARMLAWGVLAAGVVQLLVQLPSLFRVGLLRRGERAPDERGSSAAWEVLRSSAPLAFGAAVYQVNVMLDGIMAEALLTNGGPTAHYYANRVQQFPLALIAIAATSSVFPALAALGHTGDRQGLRNLHDRTQRSVCFVALPASVGLFVLAEAVVSSSFEHGAFGAEGVARTTAALRALCLAILPAGAVGLVARTYYALGDYRRPVWISSAALVLNVLLNVLFLVGFGLDVEGLALATALTTWGQLVVLVPGLTRRLGLPPGERAWGGPLVRMGLAAAGCGAASYGLWALFGGLGGLAAGLAGGVLAYLGLARALGLEEAGFGRT